MFNGPIPDELESDPSFLLSFMGPVPVRNTKGDMHLEGAILDRGGLVVYKCHRQGDYAADQNDICLGLMRITGLSTSNLKVGLHLTKCIHSIHSTHNQLIDFSRMDLNSRLHTDIFTVHWACIYRE